MIARSLSVSGPSRERGGLISVLSTGEGSPSGWSSETSASPTFSSVIAVATSDARIGAESLGRRVDRLLLLGREGAQRVLDPVAELAAYLVRHVDRILSYEIDADALGADQPHHLLDRLLKRLRRVPEQQMCLVEEKDERRLLGIAHLGQILEQLGEQPEQEGGVERGLVINLFRGENVHMAASGFVHLQESAMSSAGLAEEAGARPARPLEHWRWIVPTVARVTLP